MIPAHVEQCIHKIAERTGFVRGAYTVQHFTPNVVSQTAATVLRIAVRGNQQAAANNLHLVCKTPVDPELSVREVCAYRDILPALAEFQAGCGAPTSSAFIQFPQFYGTVRDDDDSGGLILGDLSADGFTIPAGRGHAELLDNAHAQSALIELGKLHAVSFALRDHQPDMLRRLRDQLPFGGLPVLMRRADDDGLREQWRQQYDAAIGTLDDNETGLQEEMEAVRDGYAERLRACLRTVDDERYAVLSHGDFGPQNIVFRYAGDGAEKHIEAACLIDWQCVQFATPAIDILHLMFSAVRSEVRQEHFWSLVQTYHESLAANVRAMGSDPIALYPMERLREHLGRYGQYGMLVMPMLLGKLHGGGGGGREQEVAEGSAHRQQMGDAVRDFIGMEFEVGGWMF